MSSIKFKVVKVELEFDYGTNILDSLIEAQKYADKHKCRVFYKHNNIPILSVPME